MDRGHPLNPPSDALRPLALRELLQLGGSRHWVVHQHLSELDSLTPVRGELSAIHAGTVLEVSGKASTIITLCCDRCLRTFNHPLSFCCRELIPLQEAGGRGDGLDVDDGERLDPRGRFDPAHWVFQQLQLQRPLQNRCGPECPGPDTWSSSSTPESAAAAIPPDPRWERLRQLR